MNSSQSKTTYHLSFTHLSENLGENITVSLVFSITQHNVAFAFLVFFSYEKGRDKTHTHKRGEKKSKWKAALFFLKFLVFISSELR